MSGRRRRRARDRVVIGRSARSRAARRVPASLAPHAAAHARVPRVVRRRARRRRRRARAGGRCATSRPSFPDATRALQAPGAPPAPRKRPPIPEEVCARTLHAYRKGRGRPRPAARRASASAREPTARASTTGSSTAAPRCWAPRVIRAFDKDDKDETFSSSASARFSASSHAALATSRHLRRPSDRASSASAQVDAPTRRAPAERPRARRRTRPLRASDAPGPRRKGTSRQWFRRRRRPYYRPYELGPGALVRHVDESYPRGRARPFNAPPDFNAFESVGVAPSAVRRLVASSPSSLIRGVSAGVFLREREDPGVEEADPPPERTNARVAWRRAPRLRLSSHSAATSSGPSLAATRASSAL